MYPLCCLYIYVRGANVWRGRRERRGSHPATCFSSDLYICIKLSLGMCLLFCCSCVVSRALCSRKAKHIIYSLHRTCLVFYMMFIVIGISYLLTASSVFCVESLCMHFGVFYQVSVFILFSFMNLFSFEMIQIITKIKVMK